MVAGFLHIVSDHILKRQHTLDIKVSRAGDQVLLVCILGGKLPADQVTAVIQIFAVHAVILDRMPSGWLDLTDRTAFFSICGHQLLSDIGVCRAAPSEIIQIRIFLKRFGLLLVCVGEGRLVAVDLDISRIRVGGQLVHRNHTARRHGQCTAGKQQAEHEYNRRKRTGQFSHLTNTSSVIFSCEEPANSVSLCFVHPVSGRVKYRSAG